MARHRHEHVICGRLTNSTISGTFKWGDATCMETRKDGTPWTRRFIVHVQELLWSKTFSNSCVGASLMVHLLLLGVDGNRSFYGHNAQQLRVVKAWRIALETLNSSSWNVWVLMRDVWGYDAGCIATSIEGGDRRLATPVEQGIIRQHDGDHYGHGNVELHELNIGLMHVRFKVT